MLLWRLIRPKRTQKCVYDDEMFLSSKLLKNSSPIKRLLHINFDISDVPMQQLCITAPKLVDYTGHFLTYVKLSFCRFFSSYECKNEKRPICCGVNFRLYQNMSNFMINYESVSARPHFRLNAQPDPSTLYSYNPNVGIFVIK